MTEFGGQLVTGAAQASVPVAPVEAPSPARATAAGRLADAIRLVPPGAVALALAGLIAFVWLLAIAVKDEFEPGLYLGISSVFAAVLLAAAGGGVLLARALGLVERRLALAVAAVLAVLCADELFAALPAAAYVVAVAGAVGLWLPLARDLAERAARWWWAAAVAWGGALAVGLSEPGVGTWPRRAQELLEALGTSALLVGLVAAIGATRRGLAPRPAWDLALELAGSINWRRLAGVLAAIVAFLSAFGALVMLGLDSRTFDLRLEQTVPAYVQAFVMVACGVSVALLWPYARATGIRAVWIALLAVFLIVIALDELASIHERVQTRTGVDGQLVLGPLALAGGAGLLLLLRRLPDGLARRLIVAAVALLVVSQGLDLMPGRPEKLLNYFFWTEETLEMVGLAVFLLGLLRAVQVTRPPSGGPAPAPAPPPSP